MTNERIKVAILGTGNMGEVHAARFKEIPGCEVVAAVDTLPGRAAEFCERFEISQPFTSLEELFEHGSFDAVSVATPDAFHAPATLQCLEAWKHVLCEKPLALNYGDARKMRKAAEKAGLVNMINLSYRNWSNLEAVANHVRAGDIGEIRHVEASYMQSWLSSSSWGDWRTTPSSLWRLSSRHGSKGVLGDIGIHILDFATYPVGALASVSCRLKTFRKAPRNTIGPYRLDANDSAVFWVEFAEGALGVIHTTRWGSGHSNRLYLKISGTLGAVEIDSERSKTSYRLCHGEDLHREAWQEVEAPPISNIHERFIGAIKTGAEAFPDFARGAELQAVLDASFRSHEEHRPIRLKKSTTARLAPALT